MSGLFSKALRAAGIKLPAQTEPKVHSGEWKCVLMEAEGYAPLLLSAETDRKLERMASDAIEGATDFRTGAGPHIQKAEYFSVQSDGPPPYISKITTQNGVVVWKVGRDAESSQENGMQNETFRVAQMGYLQRPKETSTDLGM